MYCAYITTLKEPRKHSNADRLLCFSVFGNNVITDLSYHLGQRVVYFPVDGQISEEFAIENNLLRRKDEQGNNIGGYLDPDKRNIVAIKLRGEQSDGIVLPIEVLSQYVDISILKDGDQITVLNGKEICKKYISNFNKTVQNKQKTEHKQKNNTIKYPYFSEHEDTKQLVYNQNSFKPGDTCYITLKMHGTSGRTAYTLQKETENQSLIKKILKLKPKSSKKYEVVSGTRRTILQDYNGGFYKNNFFRKTWHDMFSKKLAKGVEVFYEIVGYVDEDTPIMGKCKNKLIKDKEFSKLYGEETIFSYGCKNGQNNCYVYRMTMTNEDGYTFEIPWEQVQIECEKMGANCVPTFEKFIYTTWDDLMDRVHKYYDGADPIGLTHIREGVVVRIDNREKFTAFKHKNFNFKCLEGIIKDNSDQPDIEEMEDIIGVS